MAHVFVDKQSSGFVYIKFATIGGAQAAHDGLQDRVFGGRRLFAEYSFAATYAKHFNV